MWKTEAKRRLEEDLLCYSVEQTGLISCRHCDISLIIAVTLESI